MRTDPIGLSIAEMTAPRVLRIGIVIGAARFFVPAVRCWRRLFRLGQIGDGFSKIGG